LFSVTRRNKKRGNMCSPLEGRKKRRGNLKMFQCLIAKVNIEREREAVVDMENLGFRKLQNSP